MHRVCPGQGARPSGKGCAAGKHQHLGQDSQSPPSTAGLSSPFMPLWLHAWHFTNDTSFPDLTNGSCEVPSFQEKYPQALEMLMRCAQRGKYSTDCDGTLPLAPQFLSVNFINQRLALHILARACSSYKTRKGAPIKLVSTGVKRLPGPPGFKGHK